MNDYVCQCLFVWPEGSMYTGSAVKYLKSYGKKWNNVKHTCKSTYAWSAAKYIVQINKFKK